MNDSRENLAASLRTALATIVLCGGLYPLFIFGFARFATPESASGSMLRDRTGKIVGSRLVAQDFTQPGYFRPRPSAVKYNAAGAGGSNLSPAGPEIRERAVKTVADFGADAQRPLPADLAAASGSGLDPVISLKAALFQAQRVASARGFALADVEAMVSRHAEREKIFWIGEGVVNVLALNMELDALQNKNTPSRP